MSINLSCNEIRKIYMPPNNIGISKSVRYKYNLIIFIKISWQYLLVKKNEQ